jgi:hypothetical protein
LTDEFRIDTPYLPGENGCRFTWILGEDDEKTLYIRHEDLMELNDVLRHGSTAKIEMEDGASSILVNSDVIDFFLAGQESLKIETLALKVALKEFMKNNPDA